MTWEYRSTLMYSLVSTVPNSATPPTSLRPAQLFHSGLEALDRGAIRGMGIVVAARMRDDLERVRKVVEHAHHVAEQEHRVRKFEILVRALGEPLEPAHDVVTQISDRPA